MFTSLFSKTNQTHPHQFQRKCLTKDVLCKCGSLLILVVLILWLLNLQMALYWSHTWVMPHSFIAEFHSSLFVISLSIFTRRSTLLLPAPLLACGCCTLCPLGGALALLIVNTNSNTSSHRYLNCQKRELVLLSAVNAEFWFEAAKPYCLSKSMICDKRVLFTHVLKLETWTRQETWHW